MHTLYRRPGALGVAMAYRFAAEGDLDLLAEWNQQLIRDEGHRNPMDVSQLRERVRGWLESGEYWAVVFSVDGVPVAYALYRESDDEVYLRQFFVDRRRRQQGLGREAIRLLQSELWPTDKRWTVEVLTDNAPAVAFWRAVGYRDYCLTLEILPGERA
jgi:ribosomal protein S18 acetylase RimI-like enzyme